MKRITFLIIPVAAVSGMIVDSCGKQNQSAYFQANEVGIVTTIAGPSFQVTNGTGTAASFNRPYGVAVDPAGNVYVADYGNNLIRKINSSGAVSTLAGAGTAGTLNGIGTAAYFNKPTGVAADAAGNVYVADLDNNMIRMISPSGVVTTLAGNLDGASGLANGTGTAAFFSEPTGVAVDAQGNVYVADQGNNLIRKINPSGVVSTLAGSGNAGSSNGTGTAASFYGPTGVAVDIAGNVYVADNGNTTIRKISPLGVVSTLAGSSTQGSTNGTGTTASFASTIGVAVDAQGNVYVADDGNKLIREISPSGVVSTLAGNGSLGSTNGIDTAASFAFPTGVAVDAAGNVYVADFANNMIRMISSFGVVTTLAGSGTAGDANTTASFNNPTGVAVNALGNLYVADYGNNMIRMISPSGVVSTLAGTGASGSANGIDTAATFDYPCGVAVDISGNVYVADDYNSMIRKISPLGVVTTLAGNGTRDSTNGAGSAASFNYPQGIAVDSVGNVYVADAGNNLIRKISSTGIVRTLAGNGSVGSTNGMGTAASFNGPNGVAVDASGNIYVADARNNLIRKISSSGVVSTLAGNGSMGSTNGTGAGASFNQPSGVAVDASGNVYVADFGNNMIRKISSSGVVSAWAGNGSQGSSNGGGYAATFSRPTGVAVDAMGNLYVADTRNNLIRKITTP